MKVQLYVGSNFAKKTSIGYTADDSKIIFSEYTQSNLQKIEDITSNFPLDEEDITIDFQKKECSIGMGNKNFAKIVNSENYQEWKKAICARFPDLTEQFILEETRAKLKEIENNVAYVQKVDASAKKIKLHLHVASLFPGIEDNTDIRFYLQKPNRISFTNLTASQCETIRKISLKTKIGSSISSCRSDELFSQLQIHAFPNYLDEQDSKNKLTDFTILLKSSEFLAFKRELCAIYPELIKQFADEEKLAESKQVQFQYEFDFALKNTKTYEKLYRIYSRAAPGNCFFVRKRASELKDVNLDESLAQGKSYQKFNKSFK